MKAAMLNGQFIDLVAPAKGHVKNLSDSKKLCFMLSRQYWSRTSRPPLLAYSAAIGKLSLKYKWPTWAIYDRAYRLTLACR